MKRIGWWLGLVILCSVQVSPANAQTSPNYGASAFFGTARREDNRLGPKVVRSGVTVGLEGHYAVDRFIFNLRYLQGGMKDDQTLVDGELFVGTNVVPWLRVKAGRHIRTIVIDEVTERWSMWELRLRSEGEVFAPASQAYGVHTYGELWLALAGSVDLSGGFGGGRGIEGGFYVRLSDSPLIGRIGYRVDRANVADGPRMENIHAFTISLGWGR